MARGRMFAMTPGDPVSKYGRRSRRQIHAAAGRVYQGGLTSQARTHIPTHISPDGCWNPGSHDTKHAQLFAQHAIICPPTCYWALTVMARTVQWQHSDCCRSAAGRPAAASGPAAVAVAAAAAAAVEVRLGLPPAHLLCSLCSP